MHSTFISIPFKADSGMSTVNGVAKFSAAGIVLEFESKLFGIIPGGVKEARLPLDEILDVKFKKGFLKRGSKIEIRTRTFSTLARLPSQDGKIVLKLDRDDFDRGSTAVERIQKDLISSAESLPPPRTPVSTLFDDDELDDTKQLKKDN